MQSTLIRVSAFQPFESRIGQDTVVRLDFPYDTDLIALLKTLIRRYKDEALNPTAHIFNAGGWNPAAKCWYIERSVWPFIEDDLRAAG